MNCIADRVRLTLETPPYIRVKGKSDVRKIRPGDIAILCRTNGNCIEMAKALNNAGLNVSIARNGLLSCAESKLITASLRYLLNKHDNLAQAEIKHLVSEQELEHLIVDFLSKEKEEVLPSGILQSLALIRKKITELSPSEILDLLIETLDIRRITARWDNHIQRHANIDQLRFLTAEYENNCNNSYSAATLSGLLVWFNNLAKNTKDTQGNSSNTNAVQVLTYHRSKGLEWPFVICYDLEKKARETIWGLRLIRTVEQIDLNAPLENQLICYWVNPYDKQSKNTVLNNAIKDSETLAVQQLKELQEETRLLYVGLTRARDYLVFPTRSGKPTRWLKRCYTQGDESHPVLQLAHEAELWNWTNAAENRVSLTLDKSSTAYPTTFEKVEKTQSDILYIQPAQGPKDHTPTGIQAVEMASKKYKLKLVEIAQAPYSLPLEKDSAALHLPKILHQSIISMHKYPVTTQLQKITTMLEHHNLLEDYSAQQVMRQKDNFLALLKQLNPTNTVFNQPQRLFEENINIDLLLEGEQENYIFLVSDEENGTRLSSKQSTQLHKINALIQKDFPSTTLIFGVPTASKLYRVEFTLRS
jgi:ATP-dependent helicase/nuclease subunit A